MQSDVQCILKLLGYQHGHVRTTSSRDSPQAEGFGNGVPVGSSLLSTGEEVLSATNVSETLNPASSSRGIVNNANLQEPLAREFASVNSATSSSADADGPSTKEIIYCVTERPVRFHVNPKPALRNNYVFSNNVIGIKIFILALPLNRRTRVKYKWARAAVYPEFALVRLRRLLVPSGRT